MTRVSQAADTGDSCATTIGIENFHIVFHSQCVSDVDTYGALFFELVTSEMVRSSTSVKEKSVVFLSVLHHAKELFRGNNDVSTGSNNDLHNTEFVRQDQASETGAKQHCGMRTV